MNLFVDYAAREAEQKAESNGNGWPRTQIARGITIKKKFGKNAPFKRHASGRRGNSQTEKQSD